MEPDSQANSGSPVQGVFIGQEEVEEGHLGAVVLIAVPECQEEELGGGDEVKVSIKGMLLKDTWGLVIRSRFHESGKEEVEGCSMPQGRGREGRGIAWTI